MQLHNNLVLAECVLTNGYQNLVKNKRTITPRSNRRLWRAVVTRAQKRRGRREAFAKRLEEKLRLLAIALLGGRIRERLRQAHFHKILY
ncbi:MAG: hypothetical protein KME50_29525 [Nostoc desertorum CM1-VF14]|jgi:hypothetical protein|nr:hypothetical protein [Nostoc desertorum CM1-VF14]